MAEQSMAPYLSHFDARERAVICAAVRLFIPGLQDCHPGMFGLLSARHVAHAMMCRLGDTSGDQSRRYIEQLYTKAMGLLPTYHKDGTSTFVMYLSPSKVVKILGPNASRGVPFKSGKKRVTVGMKWSLGHKDYVPDDEVLVQPMMTLQCQNRFAGMKPDKTYAYIVTVEKQYVQAAMDYLTDNCL